MLLDEPAPSAVAPPAVRPPAAAAPRQERPRVSSASVTPTLGAAPLLGVGQSPGIGLGGSLFGGLRAEDWSGTLSASYIVGTETPRAGGGSARGTNTELALSACRLSSLRRMKVCIAGGQLWLRAEGRGFDVNRSALVQTTWLGAQVGGSWSVHADWRWGPRLDLMFPLKPLELRVQGEDAAFWTMPALAARAAVELHWR